MEASVLYKLENLEEIADLILQHLNHRRLLLFYGEPGSGKTTLIKIIFKKLNVQEEVSSPTFSIVNEYKSAMGLKMFHFDLYRLSNNTEIEGIGFSEYIKNNLCVIEWPELIQDYVPEASALHIRLFHQSSESRKILISTK